MRRSIGMGCGLLVVCACSGASKTTPAEQGAEAETEGPSDGGSAQRRDCEAVDSLRSTAQSTTEIDLAWTAPKGVRYVLSRKSYCGTDGYVTLATLPAGASSFADKTVTANWVYWYELRATNAGASAAGVVAVQALSGGGPGCGGASPQPSGVHRTCAAPDAGGAPDSGGSGSACAPLGAVPGAAIDVSPGDDVQSAINAAATGSKIVLAKGTYTFSATLSIASGVSLAGQAGVVFAWSGPDDDATVATNGDDIRVDGITFAARNTSLYAGELTFGGSNIVISNNTFQGGTGDDLFSAGVDGAQIFGNTITDAGDIGVLMYVPTNTTVSCNTFSGNDEQLHVFWGASGPSAPDDVVISHNAFLDSHRYTMELQGGPNTVEVAHNWAGAWNDTDIAGNCLSTTFSIATGGSGTGTTSYHVTVHDNVVDAPPAGALGVLGSGCGGIGSPYELMGSDIDGYDNYEWGGWEGGPLVGFTTPAWSWHDNVKIGSGLSAYPGPGGEAGYVAPAPGNYAANLLETTPAAPPPYTWAFTNDAP